MTRTALIMIILGLAGCRTDGQALSAVGPGYTTAQQQYPCPTGYGGIMNGYLAAQAAQHGIDCPKFAPPQTTHCVPDGNGGFRCTTY
jgi:hypothetical protein